MTQLTQFKHKQFPMNWEWLLHEPGPLILVEGLKHYGIMEHPGKGSFANFDSWATELHVASVMTDDAVPWCGLFMGIIAKRAGWEEFIPDACYRARNWLLFGNSVDQAALGDILVFSRAGGNHVALYVGETKTHYAVLGGNQSNMVNIMLIEKERLVGAQRCPWRRLQPPNVRRVFVTEDGLLISTDEA